MRDRTWKLLSNILSELFFVCIVYIAYFFFVVYLGPLWNLDAVITGDLFVCTLVLICMKIVMKRIGALRPKDGKDQNA